MSAHFEFTKYLRSIGRLITIVVFLFGITGAQATSVRPPQFAELVNGSDYIVRGKVTEVRSEFVAGTRKIRTFVTVEVREVIAGQAPAVVTLQMLGGKVGDDEMIVEGAPRFAVGDEDILFVRDNGRSISPLYAMMHGRYPIQRETATQREIVTRSNGVPLRSAAEVVLPMTTGAAAEMQKRAASGPALSPADFSAQIRKTFDPAKARARQH